MPPLILKVGAVIGVLMYVASGIAPATDATPSTRVWMGQLSESAWRRVTQAEGIRTGGKSDAPVKIQVIVDVNCPYCARLYRMFRRHHSNVPVRWVPISYLLDDSGSLAAAILQSPDPVASLDQNYLHYRNAGRKSHGGYRPPEGKEFSLPKSNMELEHHWMKWGGVTPMIIFRGSHGHVMQTAGATREVVKIVLAHVDTSLPVYRK